MSVLGANRFPTRRVLEAVLYILNTGAQWHIHCLPTNLIKYYMMCCSRICCQTSTISLLDRMPLCSTPSMG